MTLLLGIGLIIGSAILMSHSLVFLLYDALKRIPPKKRDDCEYVRDDFGFFCGVQFR